MRDQLKTALGKQILLDDGRKFQYVMTMVEVMNALGVVAAVLEEYLITGGDDLAYKLYKTKEGNWYDLDGQNSVPEQLVLQRLKRAIDAQVIEVSVNCTTRCDSLNSSKNGNVHTLCETLTPPGATNLRILPSGCDILTF